MRRLKGLGIIVLAGLSALWLGSLPAVAQDINLENTPIPQIVFTKEKGEAYAIFRRLDDVWVVASGSTPLNFKGPVGGKVSEIEKLYVRDGQGLRLRFDTLSAIDVRQQEDTLQVILNQEGNVNPLDVDIQIREGTTIMPKPLGTGDIHRATSFQTGESYLVLPTFLNRGAPDVMERGDVRQLQTAVGAVYVSREGLPIGYENKDNEIIFKPMTDALSRAASQYRNRLSPDFVDRLLAQLNESKQTFERQRAQISSGYDLSLPPITGQNRASFDAAMNRMQAALNQVDAIGLVSKKTPPTGQQAGVPAIDTEALVADLQGKIQETEMGAESAKKKTESRVTEQKVLSGSVLFPDFGRRSLSEFARIAERLKNEWVFAKRPEKKTDAAQMFAAFLIQRERAPEALGVLATLKERLQEQEGANENLKEDMDKTRILEGVANIMLKRFAEAEELLAKNEPDSDMSGDTNLWLGVAKQGVGKTDETIELLEENIEVATGYPAMLNQAARYYFAKALFDKQRFTDSMNQLDRLALLGGENEYLPKSQLLMGRIYQAQEQLDNAEQIYINLASHPNKKVANFALLHFMNLLNERGDLTPEAAIVRYENLRFNWRGDMVEEESLYRLAQLYIKTTQYRKAIERLKSLTANFPESEYADQAAAQMTKVYEDVIMERVITPNMDTLDKLALYYDFRELTPSGEDGDKLVTLVSEKLANLGLYKRAIDILERQLQFRVRDRDAVGKLGYELANIHGQNYQPEQGLKVLSRTANSRLPQSLINNRERLKAELLALDRRPEAALKTALSVNTPEGQTLQASLAWELGQNQVIIDALANRFNGAGGSDWTGEDATQFLQLITALSRTGQRERLNELRLNYQPGIADHGLESQVLFLVQAADESSPLPEGVTLPENPTSFWPKATLALAKQNSFNNTYKALRKRWKEEREQAIRTEIEERNRELRRRR